MKWEDELKREIGLKKINDMGKVSWIGSPEQEDLLDYIKQNFIHKDDVDIEELREQWKKELNE